MSAPIALEDEEVWQRVLKAVDLVLLGIGRDQPTALAEQVVSAICELTIDEIRSLPPQEFVMRSAECFRVVGLAIVDLGTTPPALFDASLIADDGSTLH